MNAIFATAESQSLNAIVTGFSFASAIAWMDVVRWLISNIIKVNKTSGAFTLLAAVLTTFLAIIVYMVLKLIMPTLPPPQQPVYAVR